MYKPKPPLDPDVDDVAPETDGLTRYDYEHLITYLRLLDADADGADWTEVARIVLHIDPTSEPARARRAWESHLARVKWMTERGYKHLLRAEDID
jgi:hypothetical protein